ncbi:MAG: hypothetical protein LBL30_02060 [Holosporales bacterium]|nr:hypothetical protein [Holosporales bacterium]
MSSYGNDKTSNIRIERVVEEELMEVFPLFVQLRPTAEKSELKKIMRK